MRIALIRILKLNCKWICSIKMKNIKKVYRARLVARGFLFKNDEDGVYAPIAEITTLKPLICVEN